MGTIAFAAAASHAPCLTGWFGKAPETVQQEVRAGYDTLARDIDEAELDALVIIANDHIANARVNFYPNFTVALRKEHSGPDEWFKDWLSVPDYDVPGAPDIADVIFKGLVVRGVPTYATTNNMRYDDNISVPISMLGLADKNVPIVPILQNCTVPPVPDERECYQIGQYLRGVVEDQLPDDARIGLLASGGTAHEPGGPKYFQIDEEFDRWFLQLLEEGDHERIVKEATFERMEEAGAGGTAELLSWLMVMAAAGEKPCEPLFYAAVKEWRCGIAAVRWQL